MPQNLPLSAVEKYLRVLSLRLQGGMVRPETLIACIVKELNNMAAAPAERSVGTSVPHSWVYAAPPADQIPDTWLSLYQACRMLDGSRRLNGTEGTVSEHDT